MCIVTGLVTATLPRKVKAKGAAVTLKVGVLKPPKKEIPWVALRNTTLVPVVTAAVKAMLSLFTRSSVLRAISPPTSPCMLMALVLLPLSVRVRVLAVSPSTVL